MLARLRYAEALLILYMFAAVCAGRVFIHRTVAEIRILGPL